MECPSLKRSTTSSSHTTTSWWVVIWMHSGTPKLEKQPENTRVSHPHYSFLAEALKSNELCIYNKSNTLTQRTVGLLFYFLFGFVVVLNSIWRAVPGSHQATEGKSLSRSILISAGVSIYLFKLRVCCSCYAGFSLVYEANLLTLIFFYKDTQWNIINRLLVVWWPTVNLKIMLVNSPFKTEIL